MGRKEGNFMPFDEQSFIVGAVFDGAIKLMGSGRGLDEAAKASLDLYVKVGDMVRSYEDYEEDKARYYKAKADQEEYKLNRLKFHVASVSDGMDLK